MYSMQMWKGVNQALLMLIHKPNIVMTLYVLVLWYDDAMV